MATDNTRIGFVFELMKAKGITMRQMAEALGLTPEGMYAMRKRDDALLSQIDKMVDLMNGKVSYRFLLESRVENKVIGDTKTRIHYDNLVESFDENTYNTRLGFFDFAIVRYTNGRAQVAKELGVAKNTVSRWFVTVDDCRISYIYRFAEIHGLTLEIEITNKDDSQKKADEKEENA